MVRRIVGELIEVGKLAAVGEVYDSDNFAILDKAGDQLLKIQTQKSAPAEGLSLMKVEYS